MYLLSNYTNFTWIAQNFVTWSTQGYINSMGFLFWPLFFSGIIGYVYLKQQSLVAVALVILLIMAVFIDALLSVPAFVILLQLIVTFVIMALILAFLTKYRK